MRIKITQCLEDGAKLYTDNFKKLVLASLVAVFLMFASGMIFAGAVMVGMLMLIAALDNGDVVENGIPYVFKGFKYFLTTLVIYLAIVVATVVLAILLSFILPVSSVVIISAIAAFAMGICVMYSFFFIYEQEQNCIEACKSSFNIVKKDLCGSVLILILIKVIGGSTFIMKGSEHDKGGLLILGVAVMVFTLPLALSIYYKAYKMLVASVADEDTAEAQAEDFVEEAAKKIEEEDEYFAKEDVKDLEDIKEAEKKAPDVIEPVVIPPEKLGENDDILGI